MTIEYVTDDLITGNSFTLRVTARCLEHKKVVADHLLQTPGHSLQLTSITRCRPSRPIPPQHRVRDHNPSGAGTRDPRYSLSICSTSSLKETATTTTLKSGTLTSSDPLIQKLCGNYIPDPVFVQSNTVYLKLRTDHLIVGMGYDITYMSSPGSCGGNVTGDHGSVYSTLYPQAYQPNTDCGFSIETPARRPVAIHITYINVYYECGDSGCYCVDDLLYIYGGPDKSSPLISAYCGNGRLSDLQSQTNSAFLRLKTTDFPVGNRTTIGLRIDWKP